MAVPQEKIYKPINGEEAIDLILNEFHKALVNSGTFLLHRVWHEFEFIGGVQVKGWSTKTEKVKFQAGGNVSDSSPTEGSEIIESRVDVKLGSAPPSLQRETLPNFKCPKCPFVARSRAGDLAHQRFCKAEAPRIETDRHIPE